MPPIDPFDLIESDGLVVIVEHDPAPAVDHAAPVVCHTCLRLVPGTVGLIDHVGTGRCPS